MNAEEQKRLKQIAWNIVRHNYFHGTEMDPRVTLKEMTKTLGQKYTEEMLEAFACALHNEAVELHTPLEEEPVHKVGAKEISEEAKLAIATDYFLSRYFQRGYILGGEVRSILQRIQLEGDCTHKEACTFHLEVAKRLMLWLEAYLKKRST